MLEKILSFSFAEIRNILIASMLGSVFCNAVRYFPAVKRLLEAKPELAYEFCQQLWDPFLPWKRWRRGPERQQAWEFK